MTGWMFNTFWARSYGPMPKAVLFWSGKLMRLATGFCAAFASAAVLDSSDSGAAGFSSVATSFVCPAGAEDSGSDGCSPVETSVSFPVGAEGSGSAGSVLGAEPGGVKITLFPLKLRELFREACQCVDVHIRLAVHLDNRNLARLAGYDKRQVLRRILRPSQPRQDQKRNQHQYCLK